MDSRPSRPVILVCSDAITSRLGAHARSCYPRECCGFLLGRTLVGELIVDDIRPVRNIAESATRYDMAPESVLMTQRGADTRGLEVLAVYHSHPDREAFPSDIDREEAIPGMRHLILSIRSDRSWHAAAWMFLETGRVAGIPFIGRFV